MITIYLADLTHCTITISNDAFPLNIGLVGAYAKKCFPDIDIKLFKYPQKLKEAIDRKVPDILGCSNYPWNFELDVSFFKYVKNLDKKVITVMGGPNISYNKKEQYRMLYDLRGILDFYALYEGESAFRNLLEKSFANDFNISKMKNTSIPGCLYLKDEKLQEFIPIEREKNLTEFPSPYLAGLMDKFFDNRLSPMVETHRGCPFRCSYCHEGHPSYNKVHRHEIKRVYGEIDYIFTRVGGQVTNFMITDPNFGLFNEDINIAKKIKEGYQRTGYPKIIFASTSKTNKNNLVEISKVLSPISMPIWLSVQSMTKKVLQKINRQNINIRDMVSVQKELQKRNITSQSETIMCLPHETFETHVDSLIKLIELQIDQIACYQLMLVQGSEMESDESIRKEYEFLTRFRVLPRSFSDLEDVGRSIEIEQIVVATKDFSFEDYLKARQIHLLIFTYYNCRSFKGFFRLLSEYKLDIKKFMVNLLNQFMADPQTSGILNSFTYETKKELFDNKEELKRYYLEDNNFKRLVEGTAGVNLLFTYVSKLYMGKSNFLFGPLRKAMASFFPKDKVFQCKLNNILKFYQLSFDHFLSSERRNVLTKGCFEYNVADWLNSIENLDDFKNNEPKEVVFHTPQDQFEIVESYFKRYGRNPQAFGKILTRLWIVEMLRKPQKQQNSTTTVQKVAR